MTLAARLGSGFIARSESSSLTEDDIAAAASAMSIADGDGDGDRGCTADETGDCTVREQWTVQIEAKLKKRSTMRFDRARRQVESFLRDNHVSLPLSSCLSTFDGSTFDAFAPDNLKYIRICEARGVNGEILVDDIVPLSACVLDIHVFQDVTPAAAASEDPDQGDQQTDASRHWDLPCAELDGQWESLVFDESLPLRLLDFVYSSLLFSDRGVDTNLVNISRVILLHGPPGTGKTTLCRALAQKLAIRLSDRFSFGKLVEVNSQSLFSKFFAESGKLVVQLFQSLHDLLDDQDVFVCVLIGRCVDEVESLSAARKAAASGLEPSDAIRVVNALLTQIDRLRQRKNVLVLATSNITEAIDVAFLDRADIKQYIGDPSPRAIYQILSSSLAELMHCGIIAPSVPLQTLRELDLFAESSPASSRLFAIAKRCSGMSGRSLRRLAFIAHARFVRAPKTSMPRFLDAMEAAADSEMQSRKHLAQSS
ncbi:hypothetical protein HK105_200707 [Polyrhizophydium stewartii]|uniref:AAA+ ATPase domain-containing protein n=1 Tax=Polyrhizophydium stewartii TaxID=2732419 RepID=A0ABR4NJS9_9FUNG